MTIATPGTSYRLTSPLTVPNENTDGIVVSTSDVGIDLNNFAILGPVTCSGIPPICTPASGSGSGVERVFSGTSGISVKNGSITGMGNSGVLLGQQTEVTNLRVRWNRLDGISAGTGSTVSGNTAYSNGSDGIQSINGCTVRGNTVRGNSASGLNLGVDSAYTDNVVTANTIDAVTGTGSPNSRGGNTARGWERSRSTAREPLETV